MSKFITVNIHLLCCILKVVALSSELEKSVILHYGFENVSGNVVLDESGQGNNANMTNEVYVSTNVSKCGQAMQFIDGSLKIALRDQERPVSGVELTIAVWLYLPKRNCSRHRSIFTSFYQNVTRNRNKRLYHFGVRKYIRGLRWYAMDRNAKKKYLSKQSQKRSLIEEKKWKHFAVTYSEVNWVGKLFVNGKEQTNLTKKLNQSEPMIYQLGFNPVIGGSKINKPFKGYMDDFYIFKKALNETELLELIHTCPKVMSTTTQPLQESTPVTNTPTKPPLKPTTTKAVSVKPVPRIEVIGFSNDYFEKVEHTRNVSEGKDILKESINRITPMNTSDSPSGEEAIEMTQGLETVALILATNILKPNQSVTVKTETTFLEMSIPTSGFTFPSLEQKASQNITESLSFPDSFIGLGKVAVVCMSYANLHNMLPQTTTLTLGQHKANTSLRLNSKVIGAAVNPPLNRTLKDPIEITFNHKPVSVGQQVCSFWNHSIRNANGKLGQWSTVGCELNINKSLPTKTVCECNHLTSFALLLQVEGEPPSEPPLSLKIITYIGCGFSFVACILCLVMFWSVKKKDIRHYLHINLSVALAIAQVILIFGIGETRHQILCKIMAILLHYFYLAAFLLMLSEGVHLVILIETAFRYGDVKLPVYLVGSWGVPVLIVGITLAVRFDSYGGENVCFISAEKGTVYAFLAPFCLILAINAIILVVVLRHVIRKSSLPISSKTASKFELVRATVRSLVILFPVMGFTWVFGILFFGFRTIVLEYLFGIFCSLQGFFIFLFQYALNSENRAAFFRAVTRWRASTTSSNFSRPDSGRHSKQESTGGLKSRRDDEVPNEAEKCHLLVYRTIGDRHTPTNGTVTSVLRN